MSREPIIDAEDGGGFETGMPTIYPGVTFSAVLNRRGDVLSRRAQGPIIRTVRGSRTNQMVDCGDGGGSTTNHKDGERVEARMTWTNQNHERWDGRRRISRTVDQSGEYPFDVA